MIIYVHRQSEDELEYKKNKKLPLRSLSMAILITLKRLIIQTILSKLPCTKNDIHPYIPIVKKGITPIACEWCAVAARVAVPMCRPDVSVAVYRSLLSRCVGQMLLMRCGGGGRGACCCTGCCTPFDCDGGRSTWWCQFSFPSIGCPERSRQFVFAVNLHCVVRLS